MKASRRIVSAVVAVALGLVSALVLSEGIVRILGLTSSLKFQPNSSFGWSQRANFSFENKIGDETIAVNINSHGLRDYEYDYEKPRGVFRILVLGDSFAEAFQVPLELSFPKEIEKLLTKGRPLSDPEVQVINAGTSGYGTDNELLFFRHEGYKYHADLVILALYIGNDIRNNWYELENVDAGGSRKPYFTLGPQGLQLKSYPFARTDNILTRFKVYLNMHVRAYAFLRESRDRLRYEKTVRQVGMPPDYNLFRQTYPEPWNEAWQVTKALILQLRDEVTREDADLVVVLIPTQYQVYPSYWEKSLQTYPAMRGKKWDLEKPNRILASFLERHGIKFIDLLPQFRTRAKVSKRQLYLVADGHWNAEGHCLAGRIISESLLEQQAVRSRVSNIDPGACSAVF